MRYNMTYKLTFYLISGEVVSFTVEPFDEATDKDVKKLIKEIENELTNEKWLNIIHGRIRSEHVSGFHIEVIKND